MIKPTGAAWYRDGESTNRVRWWTGDRWHDITRGERTAKKMPPVLRLSPGRKSDTPPGLYPKQDDSDRVKQWWNGNKWSSSLHQVLAGFIGELVMCAKIYELAAVDDDFLTLVAPWETGGDYQPFLLPLSQVMYVLPYQVTVTLNPFQAVVSCTILPSYLLAAAGGGGAGGRTGMVMGVGVSVPLGSLGGDGGGDFGGGDFGGGDFGGW